MVESEPFPTSVAIPAERRVCHAEPSEESGTKARIVGITIPVLYSYG
jgi:hypothetical protein